MPYRLAVCKSRRGPHPSRGVGGIRAYLEASKMHFLIKARLESRPEELQGGNSAIVTSE